MTRTTTIAVAILALCLASYVVGMTNGYSGCVVQASELLTNKLMRGQ